MSETSGQLEFGTAIRNLRERLDLLSRVCFSLKRPIEGEGFFKQQGAKGIIQSNDIEHVSNLFLFRRNKWGTKLAFVGGSSSTSAKDQGESRCCID